MASEGKTFSNDHEFASEQGQKGGATQPDEVYKRESRLDVACRSFDLRR